MQLRGGVEKYMGELGFDIKVWLASPICAVDPPAPTACSTPNRLTSCVTANSAIWAPPFGTDKPDQIVSANIGCITHLQSGTDTGAALD
jgi:glycolate oxidase iron-sulfur subunit